MKILKSTILLAAFIMTAVTASAQFSIGPMLVYGTDTDLGFGVKAEFNIADKINVSPSFAVLSSTSIDFLGVELKTSISELNADGHYAFSDNGSMTIYGIAGLNMIFSNIKAAGTSESNSDIGLNLGAGAKFGISDKLGGFAQAKYGVGGAEQLAIHAGVYFSFGGN